MLVRILIINGPNLNMLGMREPDIYGEQSLADIQKEIEELPLPDDIRVEFDFFQSNHEGALVDKIQEAHGKVDVIIINAGAFSHYSIAIYDALKAVKIPVIEVHLSNIYAREFFRHQSLISKVAVGGIFGFGSLGYKMAVTAACEIVKKKILQNEGR